MLKECERVITPVTIEQCPPVKSLYEGYLRSTAHLSGDLHKNGLVRLDFYSLYTKCAPLSLSLGNCPSLHRRLSIDGNLLIPWVAPPLWH